MRTWELHDAPLRLSKSVGAPTGSTPTIRTYGRSALTAVADAGDQPAAADGDQQQVDVRSVFQDLQADGALAGDHRRIGEGVDVGQAVAVAAFGAARSASSHTSPSQMTRAPQRSSFSALAGGRVAPK